MNAPAALASSDIALELSSPHAPRRGVVAGLAGAPSRGPALGGNSVQAPEFIHDYFSLAQEVISERCSHATEFEPRAAPRRPSGSTVARPAALGISEIRHRLYPAAEFQQQ